MTSKERSGISSDRVKNGIDVAHLECPICHDILWKPVACQSCETAFCSPCINQWLSIAVNPKKCPNRCPIYNERKCPPFIVKLLSQLQISCFYQTKGCEQVIPYEALDKHEIECDYQPQHCPGCRLEILKKDFENHMKDCTLVEVLCEDCNLIYKRGDAAIIHTESICLKEQLRQLRNESKETKREVRELNLHIKELWILNPSILKFKIIFDDLPSAEDGKKLISNNYRGLKWTEMRYVHELYMRRNYSKSGYMTSFIPGGSPHIAFFNKEAAINAEHSNKKFNFISISACAAWNDNLQLTVTGYQHSMQTNTHTVILLYGKPQLILLDWKNIDRITFKSSGGTPHPGSRDTGGSQVVITQLTVCPVE